MSTRSARATDRGRGRLRTGCFVVAAITTLLAIVGASLVVVAMRQNRSSVAQSRKIERAVPPALAPDAPAGHLVLEVRVARAVVELAPVGTPLRVEASYDPADYELLHESTRAEGAAWTYRVALRPRGSAAWALLRGKVGYALPFVRVSVPRDVAIELRTSVDRGFAAIELGGARVRAVDLEVENGAAALSFLEPLAEPMEHLRARGTRGSLDVTLLGNASPRQVAIEHGLGVLRLDLRGAWARDAEIGVDMGLAAGGTLWLPADVDVVGLDLPGRRLRPRVASELPPPRLTLTLPAERRGLMVIE